MKTQWKDTVAFMQKWIRKWRNILKALPIGSDNFKRALRHIQELERQLKEVYWYS